MTREEAELAVRVRVAELLEGLGIREVFTPAELKSDARFVLEGEFKALISKLRKPAGKPDERQLGVHDSFCTCRRCLGR